MKPHKRAEWQAIRAEEREATLARKARMAAAIPPELVAGARLIYDALTSQPNPYPCRLGFGPAQHRVTIRSVSPDDRGAIEKIANTAIKHTTQYPDLVMFQSYGVIEVKEGRKTWEFERKCQREGEDGLLLCFSPEQGWYHVGEMNHPNPLANADTDYADPYGTAKKGSTMSEVYAEIRDAITGDAA